MNIIITMIDEQSNIIAVKCDLKKELYYKLFE